MDPRDYSIKQTGYSSVTIRSKQQVISTLLNDLHSNQLNMIDQAVEFSDLSQAQTVINHIRGLK